MRRFPIYQAALRLYPKAYRREYSDQMVQTVADMLADQPDKRSRLAVWLRVAGELPFSIARENITNAGDKAMYKLAIITDKRLVGGLAAILVVILFFVLPGWLRTTVIPRTVGVFYRGEVHDVLAAQLKSIGEPYVKLYGDMPKAVDTCGVVATKGIRTAVECQSAIQAYLQLPTDDAGKRRVADDVQTIEAALKREGYVSGSNDMTFTKLVAGTYEGIDYSGDAGYQKQVGPHRCMFDVQIAYANPQPAAIRLMSWCSRTTGVFGIPDTWQGYPPMQNR